MNTLKKPVNILSIVAVVLILLQIGLMFLPCFSMSAKPTRRNPNPPVTEYSLMNYVFTDSEAMEDGFSQKIKNYRINDHVTNFVLIILFSILAVIFTLIDFKNAFEVFKTLGQTVIKIFSHTCCLILSGLAVITYLTSEVLKYKIGAAPTVCLVVSALLLVTSLVRLVMAAAPSFKKKDTAAA